ncbi:excinuclease ABC subunit B [Oleiharenicola lentus]|uniref:Excinuclease ABC subunit B n=1 Tax=Oleiharenicola lentus TaxID=2508720 RepID=A0A4Q1CC20_9BACT|nr:UvrB/UvrC motif-containing protein [Oleiharenicola lentus]RXK56550.1 excinuclease ABC subunit B [Oleiharenicola lentus]
MANSLKCDLCSKPATVHLTQIVNSKIHKVDLCEACAQAKGVTDPSGFSLADLLLKASLNPEPAGDAKCSACGFTQQDFKKTGRFGCPECYSHFSRLLDPMLDSMHKGSAHTGKIPQKAVTRRSLYERLTQLETELDQAIKAERYEDAARYRDEITQVRQAAGRKEEAGK